MKNNSIDDTSVGNGNNVTESLIKERARRVRLARSMTGLTRAVLTSKYGVSSANFQNWEGPRYGGLTEKAARKLVAICKQEGIETTVEWLMYGSGSPPAIVSKPRSPHLEVKDVGAVYNSGNMEQFSPVGSLQKESRSVELAKIAQELEFFKQNYVHDVLVTVVIDEAMQPKYVIGDYVAGKRHVNIVDFLHDECIVELADRKVLVRVLRPGNEEGKYNLEGYNKEAKAVIMRNVSVLSVAPVMWIRRLDKE